MPNSLKSASMPKVRASSGMIGTIREPIASSRSRLPYRRVNAPVVETSWDADPSRSSANVAGDGGCIGRRTSQPPAGTEGAVERPPSSA